MFLRKDLWRKKPGLVNFFCSTNTVRSDKSDSTFKILTEEKNDDAKRIKKPVLKNPNDKSNSDKKLYSSVYSDAEKIKARQKLQDLISDMQKTRKEKWSEAKTSEKKVKIPQSSKKKKSDEKNSKPSNFNFEKTLIKSAEEVAGEFGGDMTKTKSDLLKFLNAFAVLKEKKNVPPRFTDASLTTQTSTTKKIPVQMESILINKTETDQTKDDGVQWTQELGIFKKWYQQQEFSTEVKLKIWDKLDQGELAFLAASPPRNYFEELIMWTEQGKLWHFPINNHQGMEEEAGVDFTKHIFLEDYLEPWCPKRGPLRHFMELVLVGLSKNPVLTVQDKKEHIYWFRDYFESKKKLLQELGAFASTKEIGESKDKEEKQF